MVKLKANDFSPHRLQLQGQGVGDGAHTAGKLQGREDVEPR